MNNLITAITSKIAGSSLSSDVNGRIYLDEAPAETEFPYIVFSIVSDVPDWTFTEDFEDGLIQFDILSSSKSAVEITGIYAHLIALFDDCSFTITSNTLVYCWRENLVTSVEQITTSAGIEAIKHWSTDYSIKMQRS